MISDNGPEFSGRSYHNLSKEWDFTHDTSSPHYPESNGQVERTIQTVKKVLHKALTNDECPYLALLSLKTSSGPYNSTAPATLMFNRKIRNCIPSVNNSFIPISKKTEKQEKAFVKKGKLLPPLRIGDEVRLRDGKYWSINGKIVRISNHPRSYYVKTESGKVMRRNRRQILLTNANSYPKVADDEIDYSYLDYLLEDEPEIMYVPNNDVTDLEVQVDDIPPDVSTVHEENVESLPQSRYGRPLRQPSHLQEFDTT